jgi:2-phospho-L-lactate guanylyltransferase
MCAIVPFGATAPKTRLDAVLSSAERHAFAVAMLRDVLAALRGADFDPLVVATDAVDVDARVVVDDAPLTDAVNARLDEPPVAVVMADLPLATPDALARLRDPDADVVLAPGRGGGTNALLTRRADFSVDYHECSLCDHRSIARSMDASLAEVDSFRLATDVDEPTDLAEVLLHGTGAAHDWLVDNGFELVSEGGRVRARIE